MIRKYTEKDILPMVELENEVFCSSLGMAFYHRDLSNPLACHWVLIENGVFIGFISSIFDGVSAEILNFCIKPAFQRQTNGSRLFEFYLDYLQKKTSRNDCFGSKKKQSRRPGILRQVWF